MADDQLRAHLLRRLEQQTNPPILVEADGTPLSEPDPHTPGNLRHVTLKSTLTEAELIEILRLLG